ncbi:helix-turn-helix domain-containing protein [Geothrix fuzhouensis]|uniref:helix-turn-helix domain-containing protein n=1 Tax=Geothrix fuzhouensis TaxID=2966451 RepID=UPI0021489C04|nr:helix-turn-helix domain-containing protein [Geothrix fuzhouensis]
MQIHSFAPGEALAPFIRTFEIIEADEATEKLLVPETGLILGFRYAGSSSLLDGPSRLAVPDQVMTGLRVTARRMLTSAGSGLVLAKFRDGGAGAFLDQPLHQLFGATIALEELMGPREVETASARIRAARSHRERVDALERFLLVRKARKAWQADPLVGATLRAIHADPGAVRVGPLAQDLGLSVDGLEKRFRRSVGASPKQLASILRLRRAIGAHRQGSPLTRLALDAGYYDQAHFIRQVVAAVGVAPRAFLNAAEFCL